MDGAKQSPIPLASARIAIGGRSVRLEASSRGGVDLSLTRILAIVRTKYSENLYHRKGKGSLAMKISQG